MLKELIKEGFGKDQKLNCAEKILYGGNEAYKLGLDKESLKLVAGFGGGMGIESVCGALTGSVMVLSKLFVNDTAYESKKIKELTQELLHRYESEMGDISCAPLKNKYRTVLSGCDKVIFKAAEILDDIVTRELKNN